MHGNSAPAAVAGHFDHRKLPQRHGPGRIRTDLHTGTTVEVSFDDAGDIDAVEVGTLDGTIPRRPRDRHPRHPSSDGRTRRPEPAAARHPPVRRAPGQVMLPPQ
ncbi:hypothetical protein ACFWIY_30110 [Streptomyces sioyaensis]|uniref:hypothetical protein n=1 Tax=Streptomyces sioyaensis TaxID=67364 RepID=UPI00364A719D